MPLCPHCHEIVASYLTECPSCRRHIGDSTQPQSPPPAFQQNYQQQPQYQQPPAYEQPQYQQPPPYQAPPPAYQQPPAYREQYAQPGGYPPPPEKESKFMSKAHIIAAIVVGFVVGFFVPLLGIIVALVVGVVMYHVINPGSSMAPKKGAEQKFVFKLMYVVGAILLVLILFLPVSNDGLYLSSFRNPPTYLNYFSVLFLEPDSITSTAVQVRSPGLPIMVVPALVLIVLGALIPGGLLQKKMKIILMLSGLVILTIAPIISHFAVGATGSILYDYNFFFFLGWAGMGMMLGSEFLPGKISPQGAYALMFFLPAAAAISQADPNQLAAQLGAVPKDFESDHHTLAGLFAGLLGGWLGGNSAEELEPETFTLELTHPAGRSPNVFTTGWLFGARCIVNQGTPKEKDISSSVEWSGSGSFNPVMGSTSRPSFSSPGSNSITLTCKDGVKTHKRTFKVEAISSQGFAHVGTLAKVPADAHGCPACPHTCVGPITSGSPYVLINGMPAARVGDVGVHAACCGPNSFTITTGTHVVMIDGRRSVKNGDFTQHCGGTGNIIG